VFETSVTLCALLCGMVARALGLPALIGYLAAGFFLFELGAVPSALMVELADIGVTLLLFSIGLKLRPAELLQPRVWGTTLVHMGVMIAAFTPLLMLATSLLPGVSLVTREALLIAFALSFSSTVFAIQVLQERGEMSSRHASLAIGILLLQDVAAVLFIAISTGKIPEWTALGLLLLIPLRPVILRLLSVCGHGELFTLFGLALALGGAEIFEAVGVKGDLGALILGALLAGTQKGKELGKNLLHFKDLFLVGFFLLIGMSGWPQRELIYIAVVIGLLSPLKAPLYFWLMTRLHTPARTALLSSASLSNFSEFGLIVIAIATKQGLVDYQWSATLSLTIALSFLLSSAGNMRIHDIYFRWYNSFSRFQSAKLARKRPDTSGAEIIVLGMGNIGAAAYTAMQLRHGTRVLGVDDNDTKLQRHLAAGRRVVAADASDPAFWQGVRLDQVEQVMLALTNHEENKVVGKLLRELDYLGPISAIVRYAEEGEQLKKYGISSFNLSAEAGTGFANHAEILRPAPDSQPKGVD
jgi:glutathione-regulated potassium-efflux system ancillary protein KefC